MGFRDQIESAVSVLRGDAAAVPRDDAWDDVLSGLGSSAFDKTVTTTYGRSYYLSQVVLEAMYRENGIAAKIIDMPVDDAVRPGYTLLIDDGEDDDAAEDIVKAASRIPVDDGSVVGTVGALSAVARAQKVAELYGGALLVGLLRDGLDDSEPLAEGSLRALEGVMLVDRHRVHPVRLGYSSRGPVIAWEVLTRGGSQRRIHASRCIPLGGSSLAPRLYDDNDGWPDPRLQRVFAELQYEGGTAQTAAHLSREAVVGKYTIPGLGQLIANKGAAWVKSYMRVQHMMRSALNAVLIDGDGAGGYESDAVDFSGLVSLLNAWPERVAAVAEIPMMLLYGKSAPGMNATGEMDLRGYYDRVDARYRGEAGKLTVALSRLIRWVMLAQEGPTGGIDLEPQVLWAPLWQPSALEQEQSRVLVAQRDAVYLDRGVIDPTEVAESRFGGREYSAETVLDRELREEFEEMEEGEAATELNAVERLQQARLAVELLEHPALGPWAREILGAPDMTPEERRLAMERWMAEQQPDPPGEPARADADSYEPPKAVQRAAARGLDLRDEHGKGGTEVGVARARDLSNGRPVSADTIQRMASFFARHGALGAGDQADDTAGKIAWLLWGGDPGKRWAERIAKQIEDDDDDD